MSRLDEKHKIHADMSPLPQSVSAFLEMLEPIESYWAFPGKEVSAYLDELFERQEYQLLSNTVTYVVRMLVSNSYRNRVASLPLAELNRIGTGSQFSRVDEKKVSPSERHYFEVLFVDNLSPSDSPNYQILASLDIGRRQVEFEGFELVQKSIEMAMLLRAKIADHPLLQRYFRVLRIHDLIPKAYRPSGIEQYYDPKYGWTRMEEAW